MKHSTFPPSEDLRIVALTKQVDRLEKRHDEELQVVFEVLNVLVERTAPKRKQPFGFQKSSS